jgi:hypothetical protein
VRAWRANALGVLDRRSVEGHCGDTSVSAGRARRLHARTVGSRRERDAPAPAGPPRTHRYPSGDWLGERDEGAMRRIVAYRGRRSGRHPRHARPPNARREAAHRSWATTTRPDERRPHGRGGRREVTPLDRARLDGSCPAGGDGGAVRELHQSGAAQGSRNGLRSAGRRTRWREGSSVDDSAGRPLARGLVSGAADHERIVLELRQLAFIDGTSVGLIERTPASAGRPGRPAHAAPPSAPGRPTHRVLRDVFWPRRGPR